MPGELLVGHRLIKTYGPNRDPPREYTGGRGGPSPNFPKLGNVGGNHFLMGFGENWLSQRPPGYHTIHLGRGKSHDLQFGNHSSAKPCFSGPIFGPRNLPGPAGASLACGHPTNRASRGQPGKWPPDKSWIMEDSEGTLARGRVYRGILSNCTCLSCLKRRFCGTTIQRETVRKD